MTTKDDALKLARQIVDDEGENHAVRMFLALYGGQYGVTAEQMRKHLSMSGFDGAWPDWANSYNGHLTKAGAQLWIRHLFSLEQPEQQQEPVAWGVDWGKAGDQSCVSIIKRLPDGGIEVLATEYGPPASKPWVGLTDGNFRWMWSEAHNDTSEDMPWLVFARAIEIKLKEKNNG